MADHRSGKILIIAALGCVSCAGGPAPSGERAESASTGTPTREQLANLTYYDIVPEPVELADGRWEGQPFVEGGAEQARVALVEEMTCFGDLNGDGVDDAAVLLTGNSGGTDEHTWVAAVGAPLGRPSNFGSALVGDHTQIRSMEVTGEGWIRLEVVDAAPGDPACCPTQRWTKEWALVEGKLMQVSALMVEPLSPAMLRADEWVLTHLDADEPAPAEPPITARFDRGRIIGSSVCNGYSADFTGRDPGVLEIHRVQTTERACPPETMTVEQTYLDRLANTTRYGFRMGKLALSWQADERSGTLLFTPAP